MTAFSLDPPTNKELIQEAQPYSHEPKSCRESF